MNVVITRRHADLRPSLQEYIQRKVDRLSRFFDRLQGASVVLDDRAGFRTVEMSVSAPKGPRFSAHAESEEWHDAVNIAEARLEAQIKRFKERRRDHRARA